MGITISVAMATYNGEKYIKEQLESLATQTVPPLELVVCDDCSSDSTTDIIREFAAHAPFPVRLYVNDMSLGAHDNFRKAASLCSGSWVAFSDQDDVWFPNKFARIVEAISRYPGDELMLVAHTSLVANERLELIGSRLPYFREDAYVARASRHAIFTIHGFSIAFNAMLLKAIDPSFVPIIYSNEHRISTGHDDWVCMLANTLGDIAYISEPLAIWRRHGGSLTGPVFWKSCLPESQTFVNQAKVAYTAVFPEPYINLGKFAAAIAGSFHKIADVAQYEGLKKRLLDAENDNLALVNKFYYRAELYKCKIRSKKISAFIRMLQINSYFGRKYCSLGWRSFAKDLVFVSGFLK